MMGFPLKPGDVIEIRVAEPRIQSTVRINGIDLGGLVSLTFNLDKHQGVFGNEFEFGYVLAEQDDGNHEVQPNS